MKQKVLNNGEQDFVVVDNGDSTLSIGTVNRKSNIEAVLLIINNTTKYLIDNNKMIATESIETRNKLLDRI